MTPPIPMNLAVEDALSEAVARRLVACSRQDFILGTCYRRAGFGFLRRTVAGFNRACRGMPILLMTDLDQGQCAPALMADWLPQPRHPNLVFRVPVRQVESWLLADAAALAEFLQLAETPRLADPDTLPHPKHTLIALARRSRSRPLREDMVPPPRSPRSQGPNYNGPLIRFVAEVWEPRRAAARSNSLGRALHAIDSFQPQWPDTP